MYHEITVLKARQGILGLYYVQKQGIMVRVQEHSYHSAINEWMVANTIKLYCLVLLVFLSLLRLFSVSLGVMLWP